MVHPTACPTAYIAGAAVAVHHTTLGDPVRRRVRVRESEKDKAVVVYILVLVCTAHSDQSDTNIMQIKNASRTL